MANTYKNACVSVMYGFVEHLEWEDLTPPTSQGGVADINMEDVVDCEQAVDVRRQLKEEIVRLLMVCVQCPGASIGRLLLGFMQPPFEKKKMKTVALQDPGVLGALKSCLHSVLNLVAIGNDPAQSTGCHMTHPKLAERCYHLLHLMCANADLSQNTMRYLRNNHNFFRSQLTSIPFQWIDQLEESAAITSLKQQAWILSSVALEMRMTILKNQRSHAQQLVSLLLKSTTLTDQFNSIDQSMDQIPVWSTAMNIDVNNTQDSVIKDGRQKILSVLDCISFESLPIPPLELQLFDVQRTENVIKMCETSLPEDGGLSFIDIKSLRNLLMTEFNSIQSSTVVSQKHFILEEISGILRTVVQRNHAWEVMHCQQQVMDSWCKVVEIMVGVVGEDNETEGVKISVLFEIVQDLLLKVENTDANSLTASAHGVIFTLMAHLRQSLLHHSTGGSDRSLGPLAGGPLQSIFRSLLNCLVNCPVGMQRLRAHLYSSLLSYLQMTKEKQDDKSGLWRLEQDTGLSSANLSVLSECGEGLMDVVCRDACSGHDVAKMLSLSLLDYIVNLDRRCHWLQFMTARGYLQKICSSFLWDDDTLQGVLHPQPEALKPLYIYESKMAFLNRVASVPHGARDLITFNCLTNFNECKYIGCRPGNQAVAQPQSKFIPSVNVRYLQLLLPVLRLLLTLLTTPGHHTKDATNQVFVFIRSHMDVFMAILKDGRSLISMGILQELSLITAVIGHCKAGQDWMVDSNVPHARELVLIQSLLLSLLPNFLTPLHWKKIAQEVSKNEEHGRGNVGGVVWEEAYGLAQQVCSNLMTFCQNAVTAKGSEFSVNFYRILFTPDLSVAIAPPAQGYNTKSVVSPPSLGLLVSALKNICDGYFTGMESVQQLQKKVDGVRNMTSEEMKQLIPEVVERNILTTLQLQNMSKAFLQRLLEGKKQQTQTSIYIVEHMLCILWRHLQFFLIHCKPTNIDGNSIHDDLLVTRSTMRRLHGESSSNTGQLRMQGGPKERFDISHLSDGITVNDLEQLKVNIVKCLTDSMFKKLLDINDVLSQSRDDSTVGFIHALVRRIKKLLNLKAAAKPILHL